MAASVNIALPSIGREYAVDAVTLSWIATSFILSAAVFLIPLGRIADIRGRKKVFIYGGAIFGAASIIAALAWSPDILIVARVIQGIGGAMLFGTVAAIISSVYPPGERGRAMGINIAITYLGLSLGPFLGGLMTQYLGWRSLFWLNTILCALLLVFTLWKLKSEWAEARGETFDLAGSIIYGTGLVAVMYGLSELPAWYGFLSLAAGLAVLLAFVKWESSAKSPVLDITLFRKNQVFAFSNLAAFINYSATFAVGFLLSLYLQYIRGLTPGNAGVVLVAMPVVQAVFSPLTGRLSDRIEPTPACFFRHGADSRRAVAAGIYRRRHADVVYHRLPGDAGRRLCPLLLAQYQCSDELSGQEIAGSGISHPGHHAPHRPDVQPGNRHAADLAFHGARTGHP